MLNKYLILLLGLSLTTTVLPSCIFAAVTVGREIRDEIDENHHGDHNGDRDGKHEDHHILPDGHRIKDALKD